MVASKQVGDQEVAEYMVKYAAANKTAGDAREAAETAVYAELEVGLQLAGCTAIEDMLQEDVGETIDLMRHAGIQFWMLTGDKLTTAKQIATMCKLTNKGDNTVMINLFTEELHRDGVTTQVPNVVVDEGSILSTVSGLGVTPRVHNFKSQLEEACETVERFEKQFPNQRNPNQAEAFVVIDARTLALVLAEHADIFARLAIRDSVKSVLCCRVTPKQKGAVVKMVKESGFITLAIGDGGNDVPMIMEAHIGVGIVGKEGLQAAKAADYSIAKFKFLAKLVLVHGHWCTPF